MSRTYIPKVELKQVNLNSLSAQLQIFNTFWGEGEGVRGVGCLRILKETGKTRKAGVRSYQMKECFAYGCPNITKLDLKTAMANNPTLKQTRDADKDR